MFLKVAIGSGAQKQMQIVPINWIEKLDIIAFSINGITRYKNKKFKIYFSPNMSSDPDFQLKVLDTFNSTKNGCYYGRIVKAFGSLQAGQINLRYPRIKICEDGNDLMSIDDSDAEELEEIMRSSDEEEVNFSSEQIPWPLKK